MKTFRDVAGGGAKSPGAITLSLPSIWQRLAIIVLALALPTAYSYRVLRLYLASRAANGSARVELERAVRLAPGNSEYHHRLGRYLALVAQDLTAGMSEFRAAVALNPHVAAYWLDLARGYQFLGDRQQQKQALERAVLADPRTPEVAWEAANFYLVQGDVARALRQFRVVVENDQERALSALRLSWRATGILEPIFDHVLPPKPEAHAQLLYLLLFEDKPDAAAEVWRRLVALQQPFDTRLALPYLQYSLDHRETDRARSVWEDLLNLDEKLQSYRRHDDLITNGSFEEDILNGGFDWRYTPVANLTVTIDSTEFRSGLRSLALAFDRQSGQDPGVFQLIAVEPSVEYELAAHVRARDLEGASGPRFAVSDPYDNYLYALTEEITGSTAWQRAAAEFRTRPDARLVLVRLVRVPRHTILRGTLWIDDVSLRKK
jgi:tetratricopeptide (TPR) repeat protein